MRLDTPNEFTATASSQSPELAIGMLGYGFMARGHIHGIPRRIEAIPVGGRRLRGA